MAASDLGFENKEIRYLDTHTGPGISSSEAGETKRCHR